MNDSDVFLKTDLGRNEIKSQSLGILPREARTLLIMIDGKRDYRSYLDTLDRSKMFADFGGVTPLFELLLELQYIDVIRDTNTTPIQTPVTAKPQPIPHFANSSIQTALDRTLKNKSPRKMKAIGSIFKTKLSTARYETIKSELAAYIEKNASAAEAWGYLLLLEQCENSSQLLILIREIQNTSSGDLAFGMSGFIKRIQH